MVTGLQPVPPPQRDDVKAPVQRHLVSAAAIVVAAGLVFGLAGLVRQPSDEPAADEVVAQPSDDVATTDDVATGDDASGTIDPADTGDDTTAPADTDDASADATADDPEADSTTDADPAVATDPGTSPEPDQQDDPPATSDDRIAPSTISVQVLDAVLDDDQAAARRVGDELRGDGYRIVATNQAIRTYEKTTVMYTAGFEAQARQIAEEYGFTEVREKPDNLTDSVQVHLVVGLDER